MPANPPDNPRDPGRRGNREPYEGYVLSRYGGGGMFGLGGTMTGIDMPSIFLQGMRWKQMFQREGPRVMAAGHAIGGNIHDIRYASAANNLRNMYSGIDLSAQGIGGSVGDTIRQSVEQFKSYMDSVGGAEATGGATAMGLNALLSDLNAQRNNVTDAAQLHTIDVLSQKLAETIPLAMSEGLGGRGVKGKALGMFGEGYDAETTQQMDDALKQMVQSIRESADRIKGDHTLEQALRMKADALESAGERAITAEGKAKAMSVASFQIDRLQGITTSQKNAEEVRITARATKEGFITASQHLERRSGFLGGRGQALLMRGAGATFAKLGSVVAGLGQVGMILGSAYKGFKMFNDAANAHARRNMAADRERGQYGRMIRGTGMQTGEVLGAMRAGMTAGMDIKEVVGQMTSLQSELSHARFGEGQSITRLGKYGLSPFNVNGTTKSSNEVMIDMSRYLRSLKTDVERTQFLTDMNFKPEQMEYLLNYESEQKQFQARKRNPYMQTIFDRGAILDESGFHAKVDAASRRETKRIELENQEAELQGWWSGVMRQMNPENWFMKEYNIRQKGVQEAKSQMAMEKLTKGMERLAEIEKERQKNGGGGGGAGSGSGAGGGGGGIGGGNGGATPPPQESGESDTDAARRRLIEKSLVRSLMDVGAVNKDVISPMAFMDSGDIMQMVAGLSEEEFNKWSEENGLGVRHSQLEGLNKSKTEKVIQGAFVGQIREAAIDKTSPDQSKNITDFMAKDDWLVQLGKDKNFVKQVDAINKARISIAEKNKLMKEAYANAVIKASGASGAEDLAISNLEGLEYGDVKEELLPEEIRLAMEKAEVGARKQFQGTPQLDTEIARARKNAFYEAKEKALEDKDPERRKKRLQRELPLREQQLKAAQEELDLFMGTISSGRNNEGLWDFNENDLTDEEKKKLESLKQKVKDATTALDAAKNAGATPEKPASEGGTSAGGESASPEDGKEEKEKPAEPLHPEEEWTPEEEALLAQAQAIGDADEAEAARAAKGLDANTEAELANIHRERQSGASSEDIQRRFGPKLMKLYNERYRQSLAIREGLQEGDEALGTQEANNRRWMEQNAANAQAVETMAAAGNAAGAAAASGLAHEAGASTDDHHIESTVNVAGVNVTIQMDGSNLSPREVAEQMGKDLAEVLKRELAQETYLVTNYQAVC